MKNYITFIIFILPLILVCCINNQHNAINNTDKDSISGIQDYTQLSEKEYLIMLLEQEVGKYRSVIPEKGFVPDEETAVKIAEAVLLPRYGERIYDDKPFAAYLIFDSIWVVMSEYDGTCCGSSPHVEIKKSTGEILLVKYTK